MSRRKGFSFVELLTLFAIVLVVAAIVYPFFADARTRSDASYVQEKLPYGWCDEVVRAPTTYGQITMQALPCSHNHFGGWLLLAEEGGVVIAYAETDASGDTKGAGHKLLKELCTVSNGVDDLCGRLGITSPP